MGQAYRREKERMKNKRDPIPLLMFTALALCVPVSVGHAASNLSVEPEITMAVRVHDLHHVLILLAAGADVNERDEGMEQTPLMRAAQVGDAAIAQALLNHGAAVNAQDDEGKTALMFAAERGNTPMVRLLLDRGASLDTRTAEGATAWTLAREQGHRAVLKWLHPARLSPSRLRLQQLTRRSGSR
jgi:ankyrin repeat protein